MSVTFLNNAWRAVMRWCVRNKEAVKFGVLVGLLVSSILAYVRAIDTTNKLVDINQQLKDSVAVANELSEKNDHNTNEGLNTLKNYIQCLAYAFAPQQPIEIHSLEACEITIPQMNMNATQATPAPTTGNDSPSQGAGANGGANNGQGGQPAAPPDNRNFIERAGDALGNLIERVF